MEEATGAHRAFMTQNVDRRGDKTSQQWHTEQEGRRDELAGTVSSATGGGFSVGGECRSEAQRMALQLSLGRWMEEMMRDFALGDSVCGAEWPRQAPGPGPQASSERVITTKHGSATPVSARQCRSEDRRSLPAAPLIRQAPPTVPPSPGGGGIRINARRR